jgi:hypothetical protein
LGLCLTEVEKYCHFVLFRVFARPPLSDWFECVLQSGALHQLFVMIFLWQDPIKNTNAYKLHMNQNSTPFFCSNFGGG